MKDIIRFLKENKLPFQDLRVLEGLFFVLSIIVLIQPEMARQLFGTLERGDRFALGYVMLLEGVLALLFVVLGYKTERLRASIANLYEQMLSESMIKHLLSAKMETLEELGNDRIDKAFSEQIEEYVDMALGFLCYGGSAGVASTLAVLCLFFIDWRRVAGQAMGTAAGIGGFGEFVAAVLAVSLLVSSLKRISFFKKQEPERRELQRSLEAVLTSDSDFSETEIENLSEGAGAVGDSSVAVRFDDVSFSHEGQRILEHASFMIEAGETVQIKSDREEDASLLLKLIMGLYRPQEGNVYLMSLVSDSVTGSLLFEETSTDKLTERQLSEKCGYISPHGIMQEGSVLENLAMDYEVDEVVSDWIIKRLNLKRLVEKEDYVLSETDRQRLNIGRLLYRSRKGLVLCDQMLTEVDWMSRQIVMGQLEYCYQNSTVIIVSREPVDCKLDRVLEIKDGKIQEVEKSGESA